MSVRLKPQRPLRLQRIDRQPDGTWLLWIATADYVYGTYLLLKENGDIVRVTERDGEGTDEHVVGT